MKKNESKVTIRIVSKEMYEKEEIIRAFQKALKCGRTRAIEEFNNTDTAFHNWLGYAVRRMGKVLA